MTDFKTQAAADLDIFFNTSEFAVAATYNGESIAVIVEVFEGQIDQDTGTEIARTVIQVKQSDVAAPVRRDTVILDGETYRVLDVVAGDGLGGVWQLELQKELATV